MNESKYKVNWVKNLRKTKIFRRITGVYNAVIQRDIKRMTFYISGLKYNKNY
jgi:hypothetical protein